MSRYIILQDMDCAEAVTVITDDLGDNLVFDSADAADLWVQANAKLGWCTLIVEAEQ